MINYVWAALIIIAFIFAVKKEVADDPPSTEPVNKLVESFEGSEKLFGEGPVSSEVFFAKNDEETTGQSGLFSYSFDSENSVVFPINLTIEAAQDTLNFNGDPLSPKPDGIDLRMKGDGGTHRLLAIFTDSDGDEYVTEVSNIKNEDWRPRSIAFGDLVNQKYDALESLDFPLTLNNLTLVRNAEDEKQSGAFYLDDIAYTFPTSTTVNESVSSRNWMGVLTKSTARWAEISIELALQLIGIMMLWLGLMRIAEKAGLVQVVARLVKPIMVRLYPDIPAEGPAMGAIIMNVAANMLGLGNAATPLGLKAMEELQKVNERKEYASNGMCMLLAMNTSSVTIIPATVFGYRAAAGSVDIMKFWPVMVGATVCSTIVAVAACKILEKLPIFKIPPPTAEELEAATEGGKN